MKIIIEEYGKILIYTIVGITVLMVCLIGIGSWYKHSYPSVKQLSGIDVTMNLSEPIIVIDSIEIELNEELQEVDYKEMAIAYADSNKSEEIEVNVTGVEDVDTAKQGVYQVIYEATNTNGYSFSKRVPVLVY